MFNVQQLPTWRCIWSTLPSILDPRDYNSSQAYIAAVDDQVSTICGYVYRNCLKPSIGHHIMTALKSHRNMLVPISRLPVEILSRIFFEYGLAGNLLFNVKWTKLMFVSRHWYDIGIQNKMLWSFFEADPVFMKRKLKQLDLSGSHDLTVRIRATSFYSGVVRNLKPHRDQIHYLEISGPTNYVLPTMNALSRFALPMLRSITLNPSSDPDPWSPQLNPLSILPKSWAYVPNNIFQNTVILRSVTIKGL